MYTGHDRKLQENTDTDMSTRPRTNPHAHKWGIKMGISCNMAHGEYYRPFQLKTSTKCALSMGIKWALI